MNKEEFSSVLFLDRDGVINEDFGYVHKVSDFKFKEGVINLLKALSKKSFALIIITNQSGIGRGYYRHSDFEKLNNWMINTLLEKKINLIDVFYCPHAPESNCECRKPKPGMLLEAIKKYNIDVDRAWMLGDNETDIIAANNAGINKTILITNESKHIESRAAWVVSSTSRIADILDNG